LRNVEISEELAPLRCTFHASHFLFRESFETESFCAKPGGEHGRADEYSGRQRGESDGEAKEPGEAHAVT
jgi:hypothetical protein